MEGEVRRAHKGRYRGARAGWYNIKVRKSHGPDAKWEVEVAGAGVEKSGRDALPEVHEEDMAEDFDKFLQEQGKVEELRQEEEEIKKEMAEIKAEQVNIYIYYLNYNIF